MIRRSIIAAVVLFACVAPAAAIDRRDGVEQRSEQVMPFNMDEAMHMFTPTATGGTQVVMTHSADERQIRLIRSHLQKEAAAFSRGDFSDPEYIHGKNMPGLAELVRDYREMTVTYANTYGGGSIEYASKDPKVIAAIHAWFAAQVHDHGAHAAMGM